MKQKSGLRSAVGALALWASHWEPGEGGQVVVTPREGFPSVQCHGIRHGEWGDLRNHTERQTVVEVGCVMEDNEPMREGERHTWFRPGGKAFVKK